MNLDLRSTQVRALIAASVIWAVLAVSPALDAAEHCQGDWFGTEPVNCSTDVGEVLLNFILYTMPVWIFWTAAWVFKWSLPFKRR